MQGERLDVGAMMAEAQAATGLRDFGEDQSYRIWLDRLADAVVALDPGEGLAAFARSRIVAQLATRLRLVEDERLHPEIGQQPIEKPIVILGLPRTGTTILFDLLALDPAHRFPREWEWQSPWPATEAATMADDPRRALLQQGLDQLLAQDPGLADIQRLDADGGGECNAGLSYHFSSSNYWAEWGVTEHARHLIAEIPEGLYRAHRRLLQQMQWRGPKGRWLLKSPQHLYDLPGLLRAYPDARLIWTHRDPVLTFSSTASLLYRFQKVCGVNTTPEKVGEWSVKLWGQAVLNGIDARAADPVIDRAIVDLAHHDLVRDPVAAIRGIYARFDECFDEAQAQRVTAFLQGHEKAQRIGRHNHSNAEFGIDPDALRRMMKPYYERFGDMLAAPK